MNVVTRSVYLQGSALKALDQTTEISVQARPQFFCDQRQAIFCPKNDVIYEICVCHGQIVTHESSNKIES